MTILALLSIKKVIICSKIEEGHLPILFIQHLQQLLICMALICWYYWYGVKEVHKTINFNTSLF